jgi:hypothetical protein
LSEEAILSRWEPRSPSSLASPSVVVGSTGFDGGCKAGSGGAGGAEAWGGSAAISSDGLAFGFRAVLGIKNYFWSSLAGILFPHNTRQSRIGRPVTGKIQNGLFFTERSED